MINAQNASRLFCREAFFDHMDYYRRARNRRKWGLIRGHESNGIRAETIKTVRNVRKKFSVPVWDHEAAGSKPVTRTILTKRYRCVWRKVRRINRFRAFWGPDFFFQTIDANRCFRASAPIRTGRFPVSCRCVQPAPFFSGDFSGWQRYFSQKKLTKIWALFCWS